MKTIPYLHDLPDHKPPRMGKVCPRCRGSVVTFYRDEAPQCLSCGFIPIVTRSAAEAVAYVRSLETQELMHNASARRPSTGGMSL